MGGVRNPKLGEYALQLACAFVNPVDSTTYIFGSAPDTIPANVSFYKVMIPKAGRITRAYLTVLVAGVLGTTENSTASVRVNDTTDATISAAAKHSALTQTYDSGALSMAVAAGDFVEFKVVTPAFATNPTIVKYQGVVLVEGV